MNRPFLAGSESRTGARQRNEDAVRIVPELCLAVLADGMGGAPGGREASRLAVKTAVEFWRRRETEESDEQGTLQLLSRAMEAANERVFASSCSQPGLRGMGTTLVLLLLRSDRFYLANVGDSRAYRVRGGTGEQISHDHSLVQERIDAGLIAPEQAASQPDRNVLTQAVGAEPTVRPQLFSGPLADGDVFVLTSDGVHGVLTPQQIAEIASAGAPGTASRKLVEAALRNGSRDNVTAAVLYRNPPPTSCHT